MKFPNNGVSHVDSWGVVNNQGRLLGALPCLSRREARSVRKSYGAGAKGVHVVRVRTITVIRSAK